MYPKILVCEGQPLLDVYEFLINCSRRVLASARRLCQVFRAVYLKTLLSTSMSEDDDLVELSMAGRKSDLNPCTNAQGVNLEPKRRSTRDE